VSYISVLKIYDKVTNTSGNRGGAGMTGVCKFRVALQLTLKQCKILYKVLSVPAFEKELQACWWFSQHLLFILIIVRNWLVMNELLATFRLRFSQPVSILGHSSIASWSYLTSRKQFDYVYERNSCRRICKIIFSYV
jgi:hypothetical protein